MKPVRLDLFQELVAMRDRLNRTVDDKYTPRAEASVGEWVAEVPETSVLTLLDMYEPEVDVELTVPKVKTAKPKKADITAA